MLFNQEQQCVDISYKEFSWKMQTALCIAAKTVLVINPGLLRKDWQTEYKEDKYNEHAGRSKLKSLFGDSHQLK